MRLRRQILAAFVAGLAVGGALVYWLAWLMPESLSDGPCSLNLTNPPVPRQDRQLGPDVKERPIGDFSWSYRWQRERQNRSLYHFDRPGSLLPLMRLAQDELPTERRVRVARDWLRNRSIVVAATARNAMPGLRTALRNLARLRQLFGTSWVLVVENDSDDGTRQELLRLARSDTRVFVLGCGQVNSRQPCNLGGDLRYASGEQHLPGQVKKRTMSDEIDRGLIMSALRNEYLNFAYQYIPESVDLMLVIDPDVKWTDWDLDSILQGLYYFKTRPRLQQLCANTLDRPTDLVFDPCTLAFFNNKRFGEDSSYPNVDYYRSIRNGPRDLPPVKVDSCFQAFAVYRLPDLRAAQLQYERSHGEWMCEHNTLSRQLQEVYIDPQMRLVVAAANVG